MRGPYAVTQGRLIKGYMKDLLEQYHGACAAYDVDVDKHVVDEFLDVGATHRGRQRAEPDREEPDVQSRAT
jgi:hypothetical protein